MSARAIDDDAGSSEDLPKGSSDVGWLGMPFTQVEGEEDWATGPIHGQLIASGLNGQLGLFARRPQAHTVIVS